MAQITVLAATGRLGRALVRRLAADGHAVTAVARDAARLATVEGAVERHTADFADPSALARALAGASRVACCGNAVHLPAILAALPFELERLAVMGSTRLFSDVPDATADAVKRAEALLAGYDRPAVLLLATMIYGAGGSVIDGIGHQIRRLPLLPLPGGGLAHVQPIHIADVVESLVAALLRETAPGSPIVIAGGEAMPYRTMVARVAAALGLKATIVPLPVWPAKLLSRVPGRVGALAASFVRMNEDRVFEIDTMQARLGVSPRGFIP